MFLNTLVKRIENKPLIVDKVSLIYQWANVWRTDRGLVLEVFSPDREVYFIATFVDRDNKVEVTTYL